MKGHVKGMKKKIMTVLAVIASLMITACTTPATSSSAGGSKASSSKLPSSSKHEHTWNEGTITTQPTCDVEGVKLFACSGCEETKTESVPALGHTWGAPVANPSDDTDYNVRSCSVCLKKDIYFNAMDYVVLEGTMKSDANAPANSLKLNSNGNYVEYRFSLDAAFTGKIYLYGAVDYWKDGSNNNDQRGFTSRKSGEGFNIEVKINDTLVTITNTKTYEAMGMTAGENSYGSLTMCELGAAALVAGPNTIRYSRIESYNLNITEIHFIG